VKEHMQVPPLQSGGKGRLCWPPGKSVLVDRFGILLAKDRTVHMGGKIFKMKLYPGQLCPSNIQLSSTKNMSLC